MVFTGNLLTLAYTTMLGVLLAGAKAASAQEIENPQVVVRAETGEIPSAYGAPPDLSHGRISTLTKSYVLSPFSFELESGYEGDIFRHGLPVQLFRQEIEMGLPARFTVGVQNQVEHFAGDTFERSFTLEARYALANWNKLPFNPTISVEYRFGHARSLPGSSRQPFVSKRQKTSKPAKKVTIPCSARSGIPLYKGNGGII